MKFEKILDILDKSAISVFKRYAVPIDLAEAYSVEIYHEFLNKPEKTEKELVVQDILQNEDKDISDNVFFYFSDKLRRKCGITQKQIDGKRVWFSPYLAHLVPFNSEEAENIPYPDNVSLKETFNEHRKHFNLTDKEDIFIDLSFAGYNCNNKIDVLLFQEALDTTSPQYIKTFLNRLCVKLEEQSKALGLR